MRRCAPGPSPRRPRLSQAEVPARSVLRAVTADGHGVGAAAGTAMACCAFPWPRGRRPALHGTGAWSRERVRARGHRRHGGAAAAGLIEGQFPLLALLPRTPVSPGRPAAQARVDAGHPVQPPAPGRACKKTAARAAVSRRCRVANASPEIDVPPLPQASHPGGRRAASRSSTSPVRSRPPSTARSARTAGWCRRQ